MQQIFGKPLGARCLLPLPPRSLDTDGLTFPLNKRCVALPSPSLTSPALPSNAATALPPPRHRVATSPPRYEQPDVVPQPAPSGGADF